MIKFSLSHIQQQSPYELFFSDGDFTFVTEQGIHYSISFTEEMSLGGCDTYQFIVRKIDEKHSQRDPKVEATILSIIHEFFRLNQDVLLYICDTSDHREQARNRLFLTWFEKNVKAGQFIIRRAHAKVDGEGFYAAIIVDSTNPKLNAILSDFDYTSKILTVGK